MNIKLLFLLLLISPTFGYTGDLEEKDLKFFKKETPSLSHCDRIYLFSSYKADLPIEATKEKLFSKGNLYKDSIFKCYIGRGLELLDYNKVDIQEIGYLEGIKYEIYSNSTESYIQGSEKINVETLLNAEEKWILSCKHDGMEDSYSCSLSRDDLSIVFAPSHEAIYIGYKNYPRSDIKVRVDQNKVFTSSEDIGFNKNEKDEIINELLAGGKVLTRYQKWPYEVNIDSTVNLYGFPQALKISRDVYKRLNGID